MKENSSSGYFKSNFSELANEDEIFKEIWIIAEVNTCLLTAVTIFAIASLFRYVKLSCKWNSRKNNSKVLIIVAVLTATLTFIRLLLTQVVIIVGFLDLDETANIACEIALDFSVIFYIIANFLTYGFYWLRQKMLYTQAPTSQLNVIWVQLFSWASILLVLIGGILLAFLFLLPLNYKKTLAGCARRTTATDPVFYIAFSITFIAQIIIFSLFVHPLRFYMKQSNIKSKSARKTSEKIKKAVKSATISLVVCILSDLLALVLVAVILPPVTPRSITSTVYDFSLVVNIFSILMSFEGFKKVGLKMRQRTNTTDTKTEQTAVSSGNQSNFAMTTTTV